MTVPMVIYAQSTSIKTIEMEHCTVNGKNNGRTYSLDSGTASFDGIIRAVAKDAYVTSPSNKVTLVLYNKKNKAQGRISKRPRKLDKSEENGYYLVASRENDDGTKIYI